MEFPVAYRTQEDATLPSVGGFEINSLMRPWMFFSHRDIGWTWGTSFNPSPLGYELYFTNYLRLEDRLYTLYIKGGRPYKNIGMGFSVPDLVSVGKFSMGSSGDFWMQDVYGNGSAISLLSEIRFSHNAGLLVKAGWKERGYVMGRNSEESALLMGGGYCRF